MDTAKKTKYEKAQETAKNQMIDTLVAMRLAILQMEQAIVSANRAIECTPISH